MKKTSNNHDNVFKQLVLVALVAALALVAEAFAQDASRPDFSKMEPAILKGACIVGQADVRAFETAADKLFEKNAELVNDLLGGTNGMKPYREFIAAWEIAKDIRVATGLYGVTFSMDCCDFENEDFNMVFACALGKRFTLEKLAATVLAACDKSIGVFDDKDCWVNENTYHDEDSGFMAKMAGDGDILLLGTKNAVKQAERQIRDGRTPGFAGHAQTRLDGETFLYVTSCDFMPFNKGIAEIVRSELGNTCFAIPQAKSVTISMTSRKLKCKVEMAEKSDAYGVSYILKGTKYIGSKTNVLPEHIKDRLLNCLDVDFDYDRCVGVSVDYSTACDVVSRNKAAIVKSVEEMSK